MSFIDGSLRRARARLLVYLKWANSMGYYNGLLRWVFIHFHGLPGSLISDCFYDPWLDLILDKFSPIYLSLIDLPKFIQYFEFLTNYNQNDVNTINYFELGFHYFQQSLKLSLILNSILLIFLSNLSAMKNNYNHYSFSILYFKCKCIKTLTDWFKSI